MKCSIDIEKVCRLRVLTLPDDLTLGVSFTEYLHKPIDHGLPFQIHTPEKNSISVISIFSGLRFGFLN